MEVAIVQKNGNVLDVVLIESWMCGDCREIKQAFPYSVDVEVVQVKKVYQKETVEYYLKGE